MENIVYKIITLIVINIFVMLSVCFYKDDDGKDFSTLEVFCIGSYYVFWIFIGIIFIN